jgi:hypothetical protein
MTDKVRENYLRRKADRMGLRLTKSPRRDRDALDYGLYALLDHQTGGAVNPALADRWIHSFTLDDVEAYFNARVANPARRPRTGPLHDK